MSSSRGFAPKRQFSQNFLTDVGIARNIVKQLEIGHGDCVLEVGPGKGALTKHLLETEALVVHAVDVDQRALDYLAQQEWASGARLVCSLQDALRMEMAGRFPHVDRQHRKIIGNIPYSITSELLFWAFSQYSSVSRVVFMMQREVAKRCAAQPGTKDYGILSVASWLYSEPKVAFHVQPGSFFPRPEVTSSVITFAMRESLPMNLPDAQFMEFIRGAFSQRRKVMSNALGAWSGRYNVPVRREAASIDLARTRAEELQPEKLANVFLELMQDRKQGHD
jgi:16S rRNA (adenine1518-N6/adenine1519-N6)-dimethyltransferase